MSLPIPGLCYTKNFITREEEASLVKDIDSLPWNLSLARRTQHYGKTYDYSARDTKADAPPIPPQFDFLLDRLVEQEILKTRPNQLIINEYVPGQGIGMHIDNVFQFQDGIVSISLHSNIAMMFTKEGAPKKELLLERRSLLSLHADARYLWKHGIAARKKDNGCLRGRRISLTFRTLSG